MFPQLASRSCHAVTHTAPLWRCHEPLDQNNEETHNGSVRTADGCSHCYNILHEIMPIPIHTHITMLGCVICCDPCQYPEYPRGHNIQSLQAAVKWRHCLHCQYLPIRHVTATGVDTSLELSLVKFQSAKRRHLIGPSPSWNASTF